MMKSIRKDSYPQKINDRLWVLGHYHFHHYLLRGNRASALIETGISATADEVIRQLACLDVQPDTLIVTHPHGDHINGLPALRQAFPEATVIAGPGAQAFISRPETGPAFIRDDRFMATVLESQGLRNNRLPISVAPTLAGSLVKGDGDVLDLGGLNLIFHVVKGHAPGHLVVEIPEIDALIVSDSLGFHYPQDSFFPVFFTGFADYIATIDRLATFKASIVAVSHQTVFTGKETGSAFAMARKDAQDLRKRVIQDTRPDDIIVQELFTGYYRDELRVYSPENILGCCRLLVRRSREA